VAIASLLLEKHVIVFKNQWLVADPVKNTAVHCFNV
jgi:hypothetical protein